MVDGLAALFNSDDFMPHGHCFLWQPGILWLHVISDAGVALAYYLIPVPLIYLLRKRQHLPYKGAFAAFWGSVLAFIAAIAALNWLIKKTSVDKETVCSTA